MVDSAHIEVVGTCPLGSKCEEIKDGKIHRCMWYIAVQGTDQNTGKEVDDWACAMAWAPMLSIQEANFTRQATANINEVRNEIVNSRDTMIQLAIESRASQVPMLREEKTINTYELTDGTER